jgi:isopenicillin N synthase-like dioxygenase
MMLSSSFIRGVSPLMRQQSYHLTRSFSTKVISDEHIPIIDIGPLRDSNSTLEERTIVAKKIGEACEGIGFFIIVNHHVNQNIFNQVWKDTQDFFDLPLEKKIGKNSELLMTDDFPYGYSPYGGETLSKGKEAEGAEDQEDNANLGDMKEMFSCGPYLKEAGVPLSRYPTDEPKTMAQSWRAYYEEMENLSQGLMRGFALALDLEEDWFKSKTNLHASSIRALNYPKIEGQSPPKPGQIRASAHTDYGVLTILKSGGPGLQVKLLDGEWHSAPNVPDSYVINLGDLMSRWTNDKWRSTPHRVMNPPDVSSDLNQRRQSMAYFCNINMDADVEAIPTCVSPENPAKYPHTKAGDHLMAKHHASTKGILDDSWMQNMSQK